ncbi:MAG: dTDP-4-dehydrorhamnose 3,5-epimerase [Hyphomicrobiales bacterium]|nr:dTDP-4-dehydrorhamnose 3,5-epimerase [Hyphomicrobiales bacterium]
MNITLFELPGPVLLTPEIFRDERGFFSETYNKRVMDQAGISIPFVQDNHSLSKPTGTVRGLHFQTSPHAQDKLVRVTRGAIFDVAVDIRSGSPTFGQHVAATLSADNWHQFWVPKGFAHGFCTLEPDTEVIYKVSDYYDPDCDKGVVWDDPALGIDWPVTPARATLSDKDRSLPRLQDLPAYFTYDGTDARSPS